MGELGIRRFGGGEAYPAVDFSALQSASGAKGSSSCALTNTWRDIVSTTGVVPEKFLFALVLDRNHTFYILANQFNKEYLCSNGTYPVYFKLIRDGSGYVTLYGKTANVGAEFSIGYYLELRLYW